MGVKLKTQIRTILGVIVIIFFLALILMNPALFAIALFGIALALGWTIWNGIQIQDVPKTTKKDDDPYDSLEDDIRHHDYGYPGFHGQEDEEHRG